MTQLLMISYLENNYRYNFVADCWNNFINSLDEKEYYAKDEGQPVIDFLNENLKPWNGVILSKDHKSYIEFASEEDATMFVLRWS